MTIPDDTIRVVIPLTIRKRNGRPKILPPEGVHAVETHSQDSHILKALGRAWAWRRRLEAGEVATIHDLAKVEGFTDRFVSRIMRLAFLSPEVLERLAIPYYPSAISISDLIDATYLPWAEQLAVVFTQT